MFSIEEVLPSRHADFPEGWVPDDGELSTIAVPPECILLRREGYERCLLRIAWRLPTLEGGRFLPMTFILDTGSPVVTAFCE